MSDCGGQTAVYSFLLSNGVEWRITAADTESEPIVKGFADAMTIKTVCDRTIDSSTQTVSVTVSDVPNMRTSLAERGIECVLPRMWQTSEDANFKNFINISAVITTNASETGAILLHSALAEYNGRGVIFAAPSGTGKTTASRRLPDSWKSLCDDTTLVARDGSGKWRAHPWPTWSAFWNGGEGGQWDVSYSVPLETICFLNRSEGESMESLGKGEGLVRLLKASAQVSFFARKLACHPEMNRNVNIRWFSELTDMADKVPMYMLHLSLNGEFWKHLESAML